MRVNNSIWVVLALSLAHAGQAATAPISEPDADSPPFAATAPEWERQLVAVFLDVRKQYETHRSDSVAALRMSQQAGVERLMSHGRHLQNWVGKVHAIEKLDDQRFMLNIEIAPQVTIATWANSSVDNGEGTLISPTSPLYKTVENLQVDQKVMFDALIVAGRSAPDIEMLESPQLIARFTAISPLEARIRIKPLPLDRFDNGTADVPASAAGHTR